MTDNGDDNGNIKPLRKSEIGGGASASPSSLSNRLRKVTFYGAIRWSWMLGWLILLLAAFWGFATAAIIDIFRWAHDLWPS